MLLQWSRCSPQKRWDYNEVAFAHAELSNVLVGSWVADVTLLLLASINLPNRLRLIFLGSYGTLLSLSMMFSIIPDKYSFINNFIHHRVFLASNVILGWMLLMGICIPEGAGWRLWGRRVATLLCATLICVATFWGTRIYRERWIPENAWPNWQQEVQIWRNDPTHSLRIQPEGWFIQLNAPPTR